MKLEQMLERCRSHVWSVDDIDWDAPGREGAAREGEVLP